MKKVFKYMLLVALSGAVLITACKKKEDDPAPSTPEEEPPVPGAKVKTIEGNVNSSVTLYADTVYTLKGKVYVKSGAVLTIQPGTIIKGQKSSQGALIINRGARLVAEGTAAQPIVFTSEAPVGFRNRGDWGGVVILGRGKQNKTTSSPKDVTIEGISGSAGSENGVYGAGTQTEDDANNAASMKFCRIEFAGIPLSDNNELNSLTLGGVGSGSTFENIMISYANDDAIECFGGSANFKYVVTIGTNDDDLDTDQGYTGAMQYGLVIRDKSVADGISGSRVFECSSNSSGTDPDSKPLFANFTVFGPIMYANNTLSSQVSTNYRAAIEINSSSNVEVHNSIILGFADGLNLSSAGSTSLVANTIFGVDDAGFATNTTGLVNNATLESLYGSSLAAFGLSANGSTAAGTPTDNSSLTSNAKVGYSSPVPVLSSSSVYKTGAPAISTVNAFFTNEAYYGAFGTTANAGWNWTSGWLEWDAANKVY